VAPLDFEQGLINPAMPDYAPVLSGQFWGELRVFLAVARTRSFNRAAEILGSSQPTVSRQVKRLQDLLGCQLIATTSQGAALTEEGRMLADSASELDERLFALAGKIKKRSGEVEGVVSVSVRESLAATFIAPALTKFSRLYPKIQLRLKPMLSFIDARHNNADVSVAFHPVGLAEMVSRPLGFLHFVPIAAAEHLDEIGFSDKSNVSRLRFLQSPLYSDRTGAWDDWLNLCKKGTVVHHCDHPIAYRMLVKAALGIGLLASYVTIDASLVPLDLGVHVALPMHLVALRERLKERHVQVVYDWLESLFCVRNPWFEPELRFDARSEYDEGFRRMFTLGAPRRSAAP
jgi:DNA-binding transcriptional LysR family regulator